MRSHAERGNEDNASQARFEAADLKNKGKGEAEVKNAMNFYFSGLDNKRISFYRGRNLPLTTYDGGKTEPVNLFIHGYVLVDGKPHTQFEPTLKYTKLP